MIQIKSNYFQWISHFSNCLTPLPKKKKKNWMSSYSHDDIGHTHTHTFSHLEMILFLFLLGKKLCLIKHFLSRKEFYKKKFIIIWTRNWYIIIEFDLTPCVTHWKQKCMELTKLNCHIHSRTGHKNQTMQTDNDHTKKNHFDKLSPSSTLSFTSHLFIYIVCEQTTSLSSKQQQLFGSAKHFSSSSSSSSSMYTFTVTFSKLKKRAYFIIFHHHHHHVFILLYKQE